jgi:hypothetical protein
MIGCGLEPGWARQMIECGPATEDEMIAAFLRAEVDSPRWNDYVKAGLVVLGSERSLIDAPDLSDSLQNGLRRRLLGYRGYHRRDLLFTGFPSDVTWRRVYLEAHDLENMQYIAHSNWSELSNGTRLVSFGARNLHRYSSDERFQQIIPIAEAVRAGNRFPPLIAVQHQEGHLVLIEGHSRATAYVMAGSVETAEAFVGSSPSMSNWPFY